MHAHCSMSLSGIRGVSELLDGGGGGAKLDTVSQGPAQRDWFYIKISKQMNFGPLVPKGVVFFLDTPEIPVFCFLCIVNERKR
jgi:hypothetical protein